MEIRSFSLIKFSHIRKAGVDRNVGMAIFGHGNADDMDQRYDKFDESDLMQAVDQLEGFSEIVTRSVTKIKKAQDNEINNA